MKIVFICFTEKGFRTEARLAEGMKNKGHHPMLFAMGTHVLQNVNRAAGPAFEAVKPGELSAWTGAWFSSADAMIFIGACGIAVRAIAPYVRDKRTDPAVLSVDDSGAFVIPVLSGHLGGANALAYEAAGILKACPVITTATDVNRKFAVDVFAKDNGLVIGDMTAAKEISAALLAGDPVGLFSDFSFRGQIPDGLCPDRICLHNFWITYSKPEKLEIGKERLLKLVPKCIAVGIGCRKGTSKEAISHAVQEAFLEHHLDVSGICALSSIDLKSREEGICSLAREWGVPFLTYKKEELEQVPGQFAESDFVKKTVGIGNVCERAAAAACLEAGKEVRLLIPKRAGNGVTVAAACFEPEIRFEGERKRGSKGKADGQEKSGREA